MHTAALGQIQHRWNAANASFAVLPETISAARNAVPMHTKESIHKVLSSTKSITTQ